LLAGGAVLASLALTAPPALAANLTVTTTSDELTPGDGLCSLREAIAAVNAPGTATDCGTASAGTNTIVLPASANPYQLSIPAAGTDDNTTGDLDVLATAGDLTIVGAGAGQTTIAATSALKDRVMSIAAGANITLFALTLSGGHAPDGAAVAKPTTGDGPNGNDGQNGGGILNQGSLNVLDSRVSGNFAGSGGNGADGGNAVNTMTGPAGGGGTGGKGGSGGGIYNTGQLTLTGATITGNLAGAGGNGGNGEPGQAVSGGAGGGGGCCGDGGGIANAGGVVRITASTIAFNHAGNGGNGGLGGESDDQLQVSEQPGKGGTAAGGGSGGGISSIGGSVSVTNSTASSNISGSGGNGGRGGPTSLGFGGAGGGAGNGSGGGGIRVTSGAGALTAVTVVANISGGPGTPGAGGTGAPSMPGGTNGGTGATGAPGNPAIGGGEFGVGSPALNLQNTLLATNAPSNCGGAVATDAGHNLSFGDTSCPSTFLSGDPALGQLADNGGPTETIALGPGSAARDQVPVASCQATDQRGVARPGGPACDIGAYEVAPPTVVTRAATAITASSAKLNASVNPNQASASAHFEYGLTTAYGKTTPAQTFTGIAVSPVTAAIAGLKPNTSYHYRLVASSTDGTARGADRTFLTAAVTPRLSGLSLTPSSFRAGRARGAGTTITYSDSEAATATLKVLRCVSVSRPSHGGKRTSCQPVGSLGHTDVAGRNQLHFNGLLDGRTLAPGHYRLDVTAQAQRKRANTISATFTVIA
jgi:CSLREA domain-containing protein